MCECSIYSFLWQKFSLKSLCMYSGCRWNENCACFQLGVFIYIEMYVKFVLYSSVYCVKIVHYYIMYDQRLRISKEEKVLLTLFLSK